MNSQLFVFFGRHKCATRYVSTVLSNYASITGIGFFNLSIPEYRSIDWIIRERLFDGTIARASPYTNYIRDLLDGHKIKYTGFHLVRDPRDMVVSGYFSHLHSHPERWVFQKQHFQRLKHLPKEEGIREEIDYTGWLEFDDMLAWDTETPYIQEIKFEDLTSDPHTVFPDLMEFGNIPVNKNALNQVIDKFTFEKLSGGRKKGEEDVSHHYRSGTSGDWKAHMSSENLEYFMGKYGGLLKKYNYN